MVSEVGEPPAGQRGSLLWASIIWSFHPPPLGGGSLWLDLVAAHARCGNSMGIAVSGGRVILDPPVRKQRTNREKISFGTLSC